MQKAILLAAVVLIAILAGCTSTPPPTPAPTAHLALIDGRVNQLVTVEPGRQANELSVAVNPTDPQNLIATGKDYTQPYAGQCVWDGIYVSHDGGGHWKNANLPGSPWKAQADAANGQVPAADPMGLSRFYCATDPVVAFGPDGTAYWAVMPYQCDPASGSATGREVVPGSGKGLPSGGFNDWFWTCSSMYVLASSTGGDDWTTITQVAFGPRLQNDKMWLAVGPITKDLPHGRVLLCWDQDSWASGVARDAYYAATQGQGPAYPSEAYHENTPVPTATVCATSDDQARTWAPGADQTGGYKVASDKVALPWVEFDQDGTAHMAAVNATHILALSSADGLKWSEPVAVGTFKDPQNKLMNGFPSLNGSVFRTFALPSLAIDRTNGTHKGDLYVTWMDAATGAGRTMFATSHDGGKTWSPQAWIHDLIANDTGQRGDQFMSAVSVGPDGTVDLTWMDRRDDPANHLFDCYYAFSLDGGKTFSPALRVSNESSDEKFSHHQNGAVFLGDYRQVASGPGEAHPVWVDTRSHKADVYTATIVRPGANASPTPAKT